MKTWLRLLVLLVLPSWAAAQGFPNRPIQMLIPSENRGLAASPTGPASLPVIVACTAIPPAFHATRTSANVFAPSSPA